MQKENKNIIKNVLSFTFASVSLVTIAFNYLNRDEKSITNKKEEEPQRKKIPCLKIHINKSIKNPFLEILFNL